MNFGMPDVCLTGVPPVPVPYPNMAMHAAAVPFCKSVFISFIPGLNMGAQVPMTLGDQPGTMSPNMGPGRWTMGNPLVLLELLPGINLLCPTTGNNMINGLGSVIVPAITTVFFSDRGALDGAPDPRELKRALVRREAAPRERFERGVATFAIPVIDATTPARLHAFVERVGRDAIDELLIDLSGCPGGELVAAIELAGDFLDEGAVVARLVDEDGDEIVYRATQPRPYPFPVVVRIDRGTASAAELFAGALQHHGRAAVVGERSYGKGTAQTWSAPRASANAPTYATALTVLLPDGSPIAGHGIQPDLHLPAERAERG